MQIVKTEKLVKKYKDGHLALDSVDISIEKKITVIIGRNGAGKTTLMRILSTQLQPTSGKIMILEHDASKEKKDIRRNIVSIPQEAEVLGYLTPEEHLEIYLSARGFKKEEISEKTEKALKVLGLYESRNKSADQLSGGMKRKIFVAMALASDSGLTFLDEPTVGLDPISRMEVWSAIKRLNGNVILTTHYMEEAKALGEEIILIDKGKVMMKGSPEMLLEKTKDIMRIDGAGVGKRQYKVGGITISYVGEKTAIKYAKKGFEIKNLDIEDLFIMGGIK
jgi:ABC-2 type transport system ATP-binding protein